MGHILAIDPGNDTGWALLIDGKLFGCGLCKPNELPTPPGGPGTKVIIERPEAYPEELGNYKKVNNLLSLSQKVGYAMGFYDYKGCIISFTLPKMWKAQVPKEIHAGRVKASLSLYEKGLAEISLSHVAEGKRHNVWDAIGLGVWFAKVERERS